MKDDSDRPKHRRPTLSYRTVADFQDRTIGEHFLDCVLGFGGSFVLLLVFALGGPWAAAALAVGWVALLIRMIVRSKRFGFLVGTACFFGVLGLLWGLCFSRIGG